MSGVGEPDNREEGLGEYQVCGSRGEIANFAFSLSTSGFSSGPPWRTRFGGPHGLEPASGTTVGKRVLPRFDTMTVDAPTPFHDPVRVVAGAVCGVVRDVGAELLVS
jgi:hypothetical protein